METTVSTKVVNSLYAGIQRIVREDWGPGGKTMCLGVGRDLVPDYLASYGSLQEGTLDQHVAAFAEYLRKQQQMAESIQTRVKPDDCIELEIRNCILLDTDKKFSELYKGILLCPVMNMMMALVDETGIDTERRTIEIEGTKCRSVFGLINPLAMEAELNEKAGL